MPIYDYQCTSCGHKDEVMRKISAATVEACPACGVETFSKQLSAPSFQLSGSGWYATDFKNGGNKATSESSQDAAGKDSTNKSEHKAEAASSPAACATGCACH
ncbi:MAG: zinc ribbon domain-containing protein [Methylotenera sp.]|nr:zinc ribbon domain-containing protein [Methylotenera sp.]MSP98957.1 zinc ribbon domain-containing protein [Methylotenera sp.]